MMPSIDTIYVGVFSGILFAIAIVSVIYLINRLIRRSMKTTGDDARIEQQLDEGDTLHASGILGHRHPEEGGFRLRQEQPKDQRMPRVL